MDKCECIVTQLLLAQTIVTLPRGKILRISIVFINFYSRLPFRLDLETGLLSSLNEHNCPNQWK